MNGFQTSFFDDPKADLPLRRKLKRYDADWVVVIEARGDGQELHLEVRGPGGWGSYGRARGSTINEALAEAESYIEHTAQAHEWHLKRAVERGDFEVIEHRGYEFKVFKFGDGWYKCLACEPSAAWPLFLASHWNWIERRGDTRETLIERARANIDAHLDIEGMAGRAEWEAGCKAGTINFRHYGKFWNPAPGTELA